MSALDRNNWKSQLELFTEEEICRVLEASFLINKAKCAQTTSLVVPWYQITEYWNDGITQLGLVMKAMPGKYRGDTSTITVSFLRRLGASPSISKLDQKLRKLDLRITNISLTMDVIDLLGSYENRFWREISGDVVQAIRMPGSFIFSCESTHNEAK